MITIKQAGEMASALPEVSVKEHFGSDAYRTAGGIFATLWHSTNTMNLNLTVEQQRRFVELDGEGFVEIDNAWGRRGWTTANLEFVDRAQFEAAVRGAWENSARQAPVRGGKKKKPRAVRKASVFSSR